MQAISASASVQPAMSPKLFAAARESAGGREEAITRYRRAIASNDGSASLKASEQLGSLLSKQAWRQGRHKPAGRCIGATSAQSGRTDRREFAPAAGEGGGKARNSNRAGTYCAQGRSARSPKLNALHPRKNASAFSAPSLKRRAMIHRKRARRAKKHLRRCLGFYTRQRPPAGRQAPRISSIQQ